MDVRLKAKFLIPGMQHIKEADFRAEMCGVAGKTFHALSRENVNLIAIMQGSSESNISIAVEVKAMKTALITTHREFGLGAAAS